MNWLKLSPSTFIRCLWCFPCAIRWCFKAVLLKWLANICWNFFCQPNQFFICYAFSVWCISSIKPFCSLQTYFNFLFCMFYVCRVLLKTLLGWECIKIIPLSNLTTKSPYWTTLTIYQIYFCVHTDVGVNQSYNIFFVCARENLWFDLSR